MSSSFSAVALLTIKTVAATRKRARIRFLEFSILNFLCWVVRAYWPQCVCNDRRTPSRQGSVQCLVHEIGTGLVVLFLKSRLRLVGQTVFKFAAPYGIALMQTDDGLAAAFFAGNAVFKYLRDTAKQKAISRERLGAVIRFIRQSRVREACKSCQKQKKLYSWLFDNLSVHDGNPFVEMVETQQHCFSCGSTKS